MLLQGGSGTEPEPKTGTVGTVFPETESGTGTAGTVIQEPKPETKPTVLKHRKALFAEEPNWNRKPEPLEPFLARTVTERNRTVVTLLLSLRKMGLASLFEEAIGFPRKVGFRQGLCVIWVRYELRRMSETPTTTTLRGQILYTPPPPPLKRPS